MIYRGGNDLSDLPEVVEATIKGLSRHVDEFDSIVVRGVSGIVVGAPVAIALDKPLCVVRKPHEQRHSSAPVAGIGAIGERYIFLDDFRASGDTERAVTSAVRIEYERSQVDLWHELYRKPKPVKVAAYFYEPHDEAQRSWRKRAKPKG